MCKRGSFLYAGSDLTLSAHSSLDRALVLKSKTRKSSIVVLGTYRAQNGKPILAAMDLRPREKGFVNMNGVPFSSVVKISEDGGEGTLYSRREKYWRPSLSGEEWSLLNRRMSEEIESGGKLR